MQVMDVLIGNIVRTSIRYTFCFDIVTLIKILIQNSNSALSINRN